MPSASPTLFQTTKAAALGSDVKAALHCRLFQALIFRVSRSVSTASALLSNESCTINSVRFDDRCGVLLRPCSRCTVLSVFASSIAAVDLPVVANAGTSDRRKAERTRQHLAVQSHSALAAILDWRVSTLGLGLLGCQGHRLGALRRSREKKVVLAPACRSHSVLISSCARTVGSLFLWQLLDIFSTCVPDLDK